MIATRTNSTERRWLEALYGRWHHRRYVTSDPLAFLYEYDGAADREIAGFIAAALAYGNVTAMRPAIRRVLEILGPHPRASLDATPPQRLGRSLAGFRYRFTTGRQMAGLLHAVRAVCNAHGSLNGCFLAHDEPQSDSIFTGLGGLAQALRDAAPCPLSHLVPHPRDGSACKRMNLYLRWMVRRDDVDPGGWEGVCPSRLVMPLDTHVHRTALQRHWTSRRSGDWRAAVEITETLRALAPEDPLRWDFAITRPGIVRGKG